MGVEIEKKFLVKELPSDLDKFPYHVIEQAYLNTRPAVRVRREDEIYYMTYKLEWAEFVKLGGLEISGSADNKEDSASDDRIGKAEYNMPLDEESYKKLFAKAEGNPIVKKRYLIPLNEDAFSEEYLSVHNDLAAKISNGEIKIELDVFDGFYKGVVLAEVEFPDEDCARSYNPASWFSEDVTGDKHYSNSYMSQVNH